MPIGESRNIPPATCLTALRRLNISLVVKLMTCPVLLLLTLARPTTIGMFLWNLLLTCWVLPQARGRTAATWHRLTAGGGGGAGVGTGCIASEVCLGTGLVVCLGCISCLLWKACIDADGLAIAIEWHLACGVSW